MEVGIAASNAQAWLPCCCNPHILTSPYMYMFHLSICTCFTIFQLWYNSYLWISGLPCFVTEAPTKKVLKRVLRSSQDIDLLQASLLNPQQIWLSIYKYFFPLHDIFIKANRAITERITTFRRTMIDKEIISKWKHGMFLHLRFCKPFQIGGFKQSLNLNRIGETSKHKTFLWSFWCHTYFSVHHCLILYINGNNHKAREDS